MAPVIESVNPATKTDEYIYDGIARDFELAKPAITSLVAQLAPHIKEGKWTSILGDDAKGRIPTLIFGDLMSKWAHDNHQPPPVRKFIAAGHVDAPDLVIEDEDTLAELATEKAAKLRSFVSQIKPDLGSRTLVMIEFVRENGAIPLLQAMRANEVPFDIAVVETWETAEEPISRWRQEYPGLIDDSEVYVGRGDAQYRGSAFAHSVFGPYLTRASGVQRTGLEPVAVRHSDDDQPRAYAVAGREEADHIADELYSRLF